MATVKRFGVLSFGKFFAVVGFFHGLFTGILYFFISNAVNHAWRFKVEQISSEIASQIPPGFIDAQSISPIAMLPTQLLPTMNIPVFILIIAVSTLLGFVTGILIAMHYNSISKFIGGLEMDIE